MAGYYRAPVTDEFGRATAPAAQDPVPACTMRRDFRLRDPHAIASSCSRRGHVTVAQPARRVPRAMRERTDRIPRMRNNRKDGPIFLATILTPDGTLPFCLGHILTMQALGTVR